MIEQKKKWYQRLGAWANTWTGTIIIVLFITMFIAQNFIIPSGSMIKTLLIGDMLFVKKFSYGIPTPHLPWVEMPLVPNTDGHIVNGDKPQRGEVVVFRYPLDHKIHFIKRCVALGGDQLFIYNKDLYLHHREGDDFIRENFADKGYEVIRKDGKLWVKNPYMKEHPGIWHDESVTLEDRTDPMGNLYIPEIFVLNDQIWQANKRWAKESRKESMSIPPYAYTINTEAVTVPENEYFMMGDNRDHSHDSRAWGSVPYGLLEGTPWFIYFSIADDYSIRWDRVGKTVEDLEGMLRK